MLSLNHYRLLKVIGWAGAIDSLRRLHCLIYMLGAAGCPVVMDFDRTWGVPYSRRLAHLVDDLVRVGLLDERASDELSPHCYTYTLSAAAPPKISELEELGRVRQAARSLMPFRWLVDHLQKFSPEELEEAVRAVDRRGEQISQEDRS